MDYVFDLDGTLCTNNKLGYEQAEPIVDRIQLVNRLFDEGHIITICTARGMRSCNNNPIKAIQKYFSLTEEQLKKWNIKYHNLVLGKPAGDLYIDDKGVSDEDYFGANVRP